MTDRAHPALTRDDRLAAGAVEALGLEVHPAVWDDPDEEWSTYDAVVVRSPWDYYLRLPAFKGWVRRLATEGVRLLNPPDVLIWNARKRYLEELSGRGVRIIQTARLEGDLSLAALMEERGWDRVVVKPEVSAGGHRTFRATRDEAAALERVLGPLRASDVFLVQPYMEAVETAGEWSMVFLDGEYSHAVRKCPAEGGFLTHEEHGGSVVFEEPPAGMPEWASRLLADAVGEPLAYARVDAMDLDGGPALMELELIEPELFFRAEPRAAARFALALRRRVRGA